MADAGAAAPAATPAAAAPAKGPGGPAAKAAPVKAATAMTPPPAAPAKAEAGEGDDAWGDNDAAELQKYLKKLSKHDPRARVRVRGEEKGLESLDDLFGVVTDAQRGRGASKVVEEAKKEAEEAKRIKSLAERAKAGDVEAIAELAGPQSLEVLKARDAEAAEERKLLEQLNDVERALYEENRTLRSREAQRAKAEAEAKKAQEAQENEAKVAKVRTEAQATASKVLQALNLPPEKLEVVGPYVVRAMRRAAELGLEVGTDVPAEQVLAEAQEEMQGVLNQTLEGLQPAQMYDFLGAKRTEALVREYLRRRNMSSEKFVTQPTKARPPEETRPNARPGSTSYLFERNLSKAR